MAQLLGQLVLVKEVQQQLLLAQVFPSLGHLSPPPGHAEPQERSSSSAVQWPSHEVSGPLRGAMLQGAGARCVATAECIEQHLLSNLAAINTTSLVSKCLILSLPLNSPSIPPLSPLSPSLFLSSLTPFSPLSLLSLSPSFPLSLLPPSLPSPLSLSLSLA